MDNFSTDRGVSFDTTMRLQARSGNQESKVDAARLQRKRALDRKSQNAMRERTRLRIQSLEQQLASCGETICRLREKNECLEAENHRLEEKCALAERSQEEQWRSGYVPPASERINLTPIYDQIISDNCQTLSSHAGRLSNLTNPATALASNIITPPQASSPLDVLTLPTIREQLFAPQEFYQALPCNSKPDCLSDEILHGFITAQLSPQPPTSDFSSSCRRPNIAPLFMPETKTHIDPVSQVVTDILRCFTEIATLPEQVAGLYLMFRLLNVSQNPYSSQEILVRSDSLLKNIMQWRIKKTQEAYEDMPEWLRPIPLQLRIPHPAWMDSIPWPRARAYLITKQDQYSFEDFTGSYSSSLSVSWPYSAADVIARSHSLSEEDVMMASPIFEQHLRVLENWKVGKAFASKFPILGAIIMEND